MIANMRTLARLRREARLRLWPLEDRLAPAAFNALVSRADSNMFSVTAGGTTFSSATTVSADGRYVAIASKSGQVLAGQIDNNGGDDIFLYDRVTNSTELISHNYSSGSAAANKGSRYPTISADGRYVAFASFATNLIANMSQLYGLENVFVYDRNTKTCSLVSHDHSDPSIGVNRLLSSEGSINISANGQTIVFSTAATNLVSGYSSPSYLDHAYAYNVPTGQITLIDHSFDSFTTTGDLAGIAYDISTDGRFVVISSSSNDLTSQTVEKYISNIYRYDCETGENLLISKSMVLGTVGGNDHSGYPSISNDGKWISFESYATNLVTGFSGAARQIYLADVEAGKVSMVSHIPAGMTSGGNDSSFGGTISGNGQVVAFASYAADLISGFVDGNGIGTAGWDLFLYDRMTGQTTLVSHQAGSATTSGNKSAAYFIGMSADGGVVSFTAGATDLINGYIDNTGSKYGHALYALDRLTGTTTLVSNRAGEPSVSGNRLCETGWLSSDGSTIVFPTAASDIMAGLVDANGTDDVFVRDMATGTTQLASRLLGNPSLSPGGDSTWVQQSADGRYIVYTSMATNIVAGQIDNPDTQDVFLFDRQTNTSMLVSRAYGTTATAATGSPPSFTGSAIPVISADGRYVAYTSWNSNLVADFVDGNGAGVEGSGLYSGVDVYLFDRIMGTNTLVSHQAGNPNVGGNQTSGTFAPASEYLLSISADGRYVTYFSLANDLIAGFVDNNGTTPQNNTGSDVYVFDRTTGLNTLVSHAAGSSLAGGNDSSYAPSISADGRYIAYWSYSYTLVTGMAAVQARNIFVYDQQTGATILASHAAGSVTLGSNGWSTDPVISKDGNYIVYMSLGKNLVSGQSDSNSQYDVVLYDRQTGANMLVSHAFNSATLTSNKISQVDAAQYASNAQAISADGRYVVYTSESTNLVNGFVLGNSANPSNVYLFDRVTGTNTLISRTFASATTSGNKQSYFGNLSGDGRFVAFNSQATNIVAGFTTSFTEGEVYLYDRVFGKTTLVSHALAGNNIGGYFGSLAPVLSYDGSVISYLSAANNLVTGDYNSFQDVIAYITPPPRVDSIQINDGSAQRSVIRSMTITFDDYVFLDTGHLSLVNQQGSGVSCQESVQYQNDTTVLTLTFSGTNTQFGSLADGNYTLTVIASGVSGIGNLDGNGDGVGGDDYVFTFHRLFGDGNGDKRVDSADFALFRQAFGIPGIVFDFNNDGQTNSTDFVEFRKRFGLILP